MVHTTHPVIKYVLSRQQQTPISQIYNQFPNHSQASIRAALSSGVRANELARVGYGVYGSPDSKPMDPPITLESINERLNSLQYHIAQETVKQIKATLSKLPTSKHDHKDIQKHVGFAVMNGTARTLNTANSILSPSDISSLFHKVYNELPSAHKPYLLAFLEHYGKIEPPEPVDPKVLADVQSWLESMST